MIFGFKKRRVRVHMVPVKGVDDLDFEGILVGKIDGHYQIAAVRLIQAEATSYTLDNPIEIPVDRVWWFERLTAIA